MYKLCCADLFSDVWSQNTLLMCFERDEQTDQKLGENTSAHERSRQVQMRFCSQVPPQSLI